MEFKFIGTMFYEGRVHAESREEALRLVKSLQCEPGTQLLYRNPQVQGWGRCSWTQDLFVGKEYTLKLTTVSDICKDIQEVLNKYLVSS